MQKNHKHVAARAPALVSQPLGPVQDRGLWDLQESHEGGSVPTSQADRSLASQQCQPSSAWTQLWTSENQVSQKLIQPAGGNLFVLLRFWDLVFVYLLTCLRWL